MTANRRNKRAPLGARVAVRRKARPGRTPVLAAAGAIPGMGRVTRNVERRAASPRLCF